MPPRLSCSTIHRWAAPGEDGAVQWLAPSLLSAASVPALAYHDTVRVSTWSTSACDCGSRTGNDSGESALQAAVKSMARPAGRASSATGWPSTLAASGASVGLRLAV